MSKLQKALLVVGVFAAGCASGGGQPRMQSALDHLTAARAELQAAVADKGGHRAKAIELVDGAIDQVQKGIAFARSH
jgi:hypothetical protein